MHKKPILFFILMQMASVLSMKPTQTDQSVSEQASSIADVSRPTTSNHSFDILPLVVIRENQVQVVNPTEIVEHAFTQDTDVLSGCTIFATSTSSPDDQAFMCPIINYENTEKRDLSSEYTKSDDAHCLYPIHFKPTAPLRCLNQPEPFVTNYYSPKGPDSVTVSCGANGLGKIYWFVYKICITKNPIEDEDQSNKITSMNYPIEYRGHLEAYRFCYHERKKEIMYTKYKIMSSKLFNDKNLKNERETTYDMITDGYGILESNFETVKKQYEQWENSISHRIQKLVPPDDFTLALLKKTTYHYLNAKVMLKEHAELWDHITELIRKKAIKNDRQYIIYTAALTLSQNEIEITNDDGESQIPDTWIKIVYDIDNKTEKIDNQRTEALAIIMVNNFNDTFLADFYQNCCKENLCENAFNGRFPTVSKFVKCCPMNNIIDKYFELKLILNETMDTEFLFKALD